MTLLDNGLVHSDPASQILNLGVGACRKRSADVYVTILQRLLKSLRVGDLGPDVMITASIVHAVQHSRTHALH